MLYVTFTYVFWLSAALCFMVDMIAPFMRPRVEDRKLILREYHRMVPLVVFNVVIAEPVFDFCESVVRMRGAGMRGAGMPAGGMPSTEVNDIVIIVFIWLGMVDVLFYLVHKILHTRWIYANIHYIHHRYKYTYGIGAFYSHPVEFIGGNLLPVLAPMIVLDMPLRLCDLLVGLATFYTVVIAHGGFLPISKHLYHHLKYKYNYGIIRTDEILGTLYLDEEDIISTSSEDNTSVDVLSDQSQSTSSISADDMEVWSGGGAVPGAVRATWL
jgi:sterol desaturase/sphingolipid hydroxylase (fatty acid hydroxylase superfamily)